MTTVKTYEQIMDEVRREQPFPSPEEAEAGAPDDDASFWEECDRRARAAGLALPPG